MVSDYFNVLYLSLGPQSENCHNAQDSQADMPPIPGTVCSEQGHFEA